MRIAMIGAGTMGSGIAQKYAQEGIDVVLIDVDQQRVEAGLARIRTTLAEAVERQILRPAQAEDVLSRIDGRAGLEAAAGCDVVIEAVFEDLQVKSDLFIKLAAIVDATTVLATNTSSFYVHQLASVTPNPERVIGLHYFFHPAKNRLVEVVPHTGTDPEITSRIWALQERIGKTPIASADAPGFVVNRYFVPWLNEAIRLYAENVADIPTIEAVAKEAFGVGMGPFELMNVTGIPIALHASNTLGRELGDFYAPHPRLGQQVESGELWPLEGAANERGAAAARTRMLGAVFFVACELVDQDIATIEDSDIGARVGLRWRKGPFELINRCGLSEATRCAQSVATPHNLELPALLVEQARSNQPFAIRLVRTDIEGERATITLNRPDAMNALNEALVGQLREAFVAVDGNPELKTIVLRGAGKAFVAGADVRWFVRMIKQDNLDAIVNFTRTGQELFSAFGASAKTVIAVLDGLSLGGGSELALACDYIVATDRGTIGFPETGIGIYPGLGGTQRLPRRIGTGLARYLIYTGRVVDGTTAKTLGLVDRLVDHNDLPAAIAELSAVGKPGERAPRHGGDLPEPWASAATAFDCSADELLAGKITTDNEKLTRDAARATKRAPIALRIADELVAGALDWPLHEGLERELAHLTEVFTSTDGLVGLQSVGSRARPEFTGK